MRELINFHSKRRIVAVGLAVLAIWPLVHIGVVRLTGISPWRGFGWGMYTQPVFDVRVGVKALEAGPGAPAPVAEDARVVVEEIKGYIKRFQALGPNARPDRAAQAVARAYPHLKRFAITAEQNALDRESARITEGCLGRFTYRRDAAGRAEFVSAERR